MHPDGNCFWPPRLARHFPGLAVVLACGGRGGSPIFFVLNPILSIPPKHPAEARFGSCPRSLSHCCSRTRRPWHRRSAWPHITRWSVTARGTRFTCAGIPRRRGFGLPAGTPCPLSFPGGVRRRRIVFPHAGVTEYRSPPTTSFIPGADMSRRKQAILTHTVSIVSLEPKRSARGRFCRRNLGCALLTPSPSRWISALRRLTSCWCVALK